MKKPWSVHTLDNLFMVGVKAEVFLNDGLQWVYAVAKPYPSYFSDRLEAAWWVLTGRAEAIIWPKYGELEKILTPKKSDV